MSTPAAATSPTWSAPGKLFLAGEYAVLARRHRASWPPSTATRRAASTATPRRRALVAAALRRCAPTSMDERAGRAAARRRARGRHRDVRGRRTQAGARLQRRGRGPSRSRPRSTPRAPAPCARTTPAARWCSRSPTAPTAPPRAAAARGPTSRPRCTAASSRSCAPPGRAARGAAHRPDRTRLARRAGGLLRRAPSATVDQVRAVERLAERDPALHAACVADVRAAGEELLRAWEHADGPGVVDAATRAGGARWRRSAAAPPSRSGPTRCAPRPRWRASSAAPPSRRARAAATSGWRSSPIRPRRPRSGNAPPMAASKSLIWRPPLAASHAVGLETGRHVRTMHASPPLRSRIPGFYRLPLDERRRQLRLRADLSAEDLRTLDQGGIDTATADRVVENAIGVYALPLGVGAQLPRQRPRRTWSRWPSRSRR